MSWRAYRPSAMLVLAVVLLALLAVLGTLQHRWLSQVSAAERDRLRATLGTRSTQFAQDFDRELTRAFFWLQLGPTPSEDTVEGATERYSRWFEAAPHAGLVRDIYRVGAEQPGTPLRLHWYDRTAHRIEPLEEWPRELEPWKAQIDEYYASADGDHLRPPPSLLTPIDPDIPALIIARPLVRFRDTHRKGAGVLLTPPFGFTIAKLDVDYMRSQFLPLLTDRYFSASEGANYDVSVIDTQSGATIFASVGSGAHGSGEPDAKAPMLDVRFGELGRFVLDDRAAASPERRFERRETYALNVFREPMPPDRGARPRSTPRWELQLTHRAGSLEAAVQSTLRKNLGISSGVLVLLALSIGLVMLSAARARRLANQRMEFVAGVSHELRTPLAVIRSAAQNLEDGVVTDAPQVQRYGQLIAIEGRRLTQMVEQVMELAGIESGGRAPERRAVEVDGLIDDALAASGPLLNDVEIEVEQVVEERLPLVLVEPASLTRCIQNLISNAVKYGGSTRWLRIDARLAASSRNSEVLLSVEDRGAGIAPDDLPHIFEPFYRGHDGVAAQIQGSGLGLSLVQRVMRSMGGRVSVKSQIGSGTTFTLHLPVAPAGTAAASEERLA